MIDFINELFISLIIIQNKPSDIIKLNSKLCLLYFFIKSTIFCLQKDRYSQIEIVLPF